MTHSILMKSWRESDPATVAEIDAPLSLRHILGAPPADTWWSLHRNLLWSFTGWVTSVAVVASAGYLLWAMMFHHESDADPFLGLQRPRATSTTAAPLGDQADVAEVLKVVRPEPLTVATTTVNGVAAEGTTASLGAGREGSGRSGPNPGPAGPASPTTEASGSAGTTGTSASGGGGNRGPGGSSSTSAATTTTTRSTDTSSSTTSSSTTRSSTTSTTTTRGTSSTSTSSTVDDKGGGSGSGSGGGSGSGSGGSGKG